MLCVLGAGQEYPFFTHKVSLGKDYTLHLKEEVVFGRFKSRKCSLACRASFSLGHHLHKAIVPVWSQHSEQVAVPASVGSHMWSSSSCD